MRSTLQDEMRHVRRKPVLYRNDWTNQVGFWHGDVLPPM